MRSLTDMAGDLNSSTAQVLTALRIVATRAGVNDLAEWAARETEGYSEEDALPAHRIWRATIIGSFHNPMQGFMTDVQLGDFAVAEEHREYATTFHCRQGVAVIEASLGDDKDGSGNFGIEVPNLVALINSGPMRSHVWTCTHADARFSKVRLQDVVNRARQTALGLCLKCEEDGVELHWSGGAEATQEERTQWRSTLRDEGTKVVLRAAWETLREAVFGA